MSEKITCNFNNSAY